MKLQLVPLHEKYKKNLNEMMDEWCASGERIVPSALTRCNYHDFDQYRNNIENKENNGPLVPDTTLFCLDKDRDIFVGAVNIRHYLNDFLLLNGGHIGDGVRPSERRKGIASKMIGLALKECKKIGLDKVLMVCDK